MMFMLLILVHVDIGKTETGSTNGIETPEERTHLLDPTISA